MSFQNYEFQNQHQPADAAAPAGAPAPTDTNMTGQGDPSPAPFTGPAPGEPSAAPVAPQGGDGKTTLWMGELEPWIDENFIRNLWFQMGEQVNVKMIRDKFSGSNAGYCFVDFPSPTAAAKALSLNGTPMPNTTRAFKLNWATGGGLADRGRDDRGPEYSIFVGDLGPEVNEYVLVSLFQSRFPSCKSAKIMTDPISGMSRGYGFVRFSDENDQQRALSEMQGVYCGNRPMRISTATPKNKGPGVGPGGAMGMPGPAGLYPPNMGGPPMGFYGAPQPMNQFTDPNNTTVFVGGLSGYVTEDELRSFFQGFGEITYVKIPPGKGCGFVQFVQRHAAEMAINQMQGYPIGNSRVRLSWGRSQNNSGPAGTPYRPAPPPPIYPNMGMPPAHQYGNFAPMKHSLEYAAPSAVCGTAAGTSSSSQPTRKYRFRSFALNAVLPVTRAGNSCNTDSPYLLNTSFINPQHFFNQKWLGQLPILTSFIPSLPQQSPFRVSIHSWEKPCPSRVVESLMHPDDCVLFEVRIYMDNVCVAGSLFSPRTFWPHVIGDVECSSQMDKNGNQELLRFPTFHPEVLDQYVWDAADTYGRLRIVVSEGLARPHRVPPFERVKDIVVFSFQHAPLNILENCGIAWPNPNMWSQLPANLFRHQLNYGGYGAFGDHKDHMDDLHTHSPTRHDSTRLETSRINDNGGGLHDLYSNIPPWAQKSFVPAPAAPQPPPPAMNWANIYGDSRLNLQPSNFGGMYNNAFTGLDPFVDPPMAHRINQMQRSLDDISMPDAGPMSVSSRAMSSINGMSYDHSQQASLAASRDDDHYNVIELTSPAKAQQASSALQNSVPSIPPVSRPSAAAQARSESYSKATSKVPHAESKDPRQVSGSSVRSGQGGSVVETITTRRLLVSPKDQVKGRKEGKAALAQKSSQAGSEPPSEPSSRELSREVSREVSREIGKPGVRHPNVVVHTTESVVRVSSEAKRKRQVKAPDEASQTSESPTKKMSRVEKARSVATEDGEID
ncbi:putative RNA-binding protein C23E6,01c [Talaromyces islandicus]|uniref:Putative RNA-binding protein C23E6,01c n=1 Tax=Talaromyces islandicus TaxID=28573 RepID=A0A0U1M845_TALIS|nr:putative RNA-binding protein C23E6,01c [Talaromyces islandicus]